jgi:hypothetical protein
MPTIYTLPRTTDAAASDLLAVWSQALGAEAAMPFSVFAAYIESLSNAGRITAQHAAPSATGFTVTVTSPNVHLLMTPGADYATGTIALPTATDGDTLTVSSTRAVAALTLSNGSVFGAPAALTAHGFFTLRYDAVTSAWYRIG